MKKGPLSRARRQVPVSCAAAILAGAFAFSGEAEAVTVFVEGFEGAGTANSFAMPTYAYSMNYTVANGLSVSGGSRYAHGGAGANGAVSTNTYSSTANPVSLVSSGFTAGQVDSGIVAFNFYAQFSAYHDQTDFAEVTATFLNGSNAVLSSVKLGGAAFIAALTPTGNVNKNWAADTLSGTIPAGARSVTFTVSETKAAGGVNIDGYLDNVKFDINAVPEPGITGLALGALGLTLGTRRRQRSL